MSYFKCKSLYIDDSSEGDECEPDDGGTRAARRAVYVGLSVADGITGGRWHTDGPGIRSGARGPLGNRSIR